MDDRFGHQTRRWTVVKITASLLTERQAVRQIIYSMTTYIKALEYYLPEGIVTNQDLARQFPEWDADKVARKTGIEERHVAGNGETASDLAFCAAQKLFDRHPDYREKVDFLLLCTQSPDYKLPTTACVLQHRLGLPTTVGALDFNLGCSGFVYGLALAKGLIASGTASHVLLLTAETYSKYFHPADKGNMSIFGDGAAATLIAGDGFAAIGELVLGTDGSGAENLQVVTGGARHPQPMGLDERDENGYVKASDHLYMNGPEIFNFTLDTVPPLLDSCLAANHLTKEEVDCYVMHQANKYMLDTLRKVYGIPKEKFYVNLSATGNTVSSTIPIALCNAMEEGVVRKGQKVAVAGFGVGYSYGACILDF